MLNTLNLSRNSLKTAVNLERLIECKTVSVLDLSHNRIDDILIVKILSQMPELRVLVLTGNPVVNEIPSYRKTLIIECVSSIVWFHPIMCVNVYACMRMPLCRVSQSSIGTMRSLSLSYFA